jgi:hypothetical protein
MLQHGEYGTYGSIPALVMRSGQIRPVSPDDARQDLNTAHVLRMTDWRMKIPAEPIVVPIPAPPSPITSAVAQTVTAIPPAPIQTAPATPLPADASDKHHWHTVHRGGGSHAMIREIQRLHPKAGLRGSNDVELGEWNGRPIAKFEIASSPPAGGAEIAAGAMRQAAHALRTSGLASLPPELIGGPLAALMRGGAVELHFQNGAVVRTVL